MASLHPCQVGDLVSQGSIAFNATEKGDEKGQSPSSPFCPHNIAPSNLHTGEGFESLMHLMTRDCWLCSREGSDNINFASNQKLQKRAVKELE